MVDVWLLSPEYVACLRCSLFLVFFWVSLMGSNYCPIYQPGLPTGAKCVLCSAWIREHLPSFGVKLPSENGTVVDRLSLRQHVPIQLWVLKKCLEWDSSDSSQGVLLGMKIALKLWESCPEIIYTYILYPFKNSHNILNQLERMNKAVRFIENCAIVRKSIPYIGRMYAKILGEIKHFLAE